MHDTPQDAAFKWELCRALLARPSPCRASNSTKPTHPRRNVSMRQLRAHLPTLTYPTDITRRNGCGEASDTFEQTFSPGRMELTLSTQTFDIDAVLAASTCWAGGGLQVQVDWGRYTSIAFVRRACDALWHLLAHRKVSYLSIAVSVERADAGECVLRLLRRYFERPLHSAACIALELRRIAAPLELLLSPVPAQRTDMLRELKLDHCLFVDGSLPRFVSAQRRLGQLHLAHIKELDRGPCWEQLGSAVGKTMSLRLVTLRQCTVGEVQLDQFFNGLRRFLPRPRFEIAVDGAAAANMPAALLRAPPCVVQALTGITLSGADEMSWRSDELARVVVVCSRLACLRLNSSAAPPPGERDARSGCAEWAQRVIRVVGDAARRWEAVQLGRAGEELPVSVLRRVSALPFASGASLSLSGSGLWRSFQKMSIHQCLPALQHLDLSGCGLCDDALGHLAQALDKLDIVPLKRLGLESNITQPWAARKSGKGLLRLLKSLRSCRAPALEVMRLLGNALPASAVALLLDQVARGLRYLSITLRPSPADMEIVIGSVVRRQRSAESFPRLDVEYALPRETTLRVTRRDLEFLRDEMGVRFLRAADPAGQDERTLCCREV
eukprot:gene10897-7555_t